MLLSILFPPVFSMCSSISSISPPPLPVLLSIVTPFGGSFSLLSCSAHAWRMQFFPLPPSSGIMTPIRFSFSVFCPPLALFPHTLLSFHILICFLSFLSQETVFWTYWKHWTTLPFPLDCQSSWWYEQIHYHASLSDSSLVHWWS